MLDPGDPEPDRETVKSIASCLENTVWLAIEAKLLDGALENATPLVGLYQKLLSNQFEPELLPRLAAAYNLRGVSMSRSQPARRGRGDFTETIDLYRKMVNLWGRLQHERDLASAFLNCGLARHELKKRDESLTDLERACAIFHRLTMRRSFSEQERGEALTLTHIARVRRDGGEWEAAAETYARSLELLERSNVWGCDRTGTPGPVRHRRRGVPRARCLPPLPRGVRPLGRQAGSALGRTRSGEDTRRHDRDG